MKARFLNIAFCLLLSVFVCATETVIVGTVIDERSSMPIENVHLYYKGTTIGCTTNAEGMFMLRVDMQGKHTLIVSAVGYQSQRYKIEEGQYAGIQVLLKEDNTFLQDIFVTPDENPALKIINQTRKHKENNDITLNPIVEETIEEQKELYISDIEHKHLQRALWRSLKSGMIEAEDSTMLIPLYLASQDFKIQGNNISKLTNPTERSAVLTETNYSVLLEGLSHRLNFYNNSVILFGKSFISPLSATATKHYKFYLADSIGSGNEKQYILHFRTKNPYELTFNGEMRIDSATYALRQIEATVPREVSVNYLSSIQIHQEFAADNSLEKEYISTIFDFAIKADNSHTFPTALLKRSSVKKSISDSPISLERDSSIIAAMDSIENQPIVKVAKFAAHIINTGNIPTGECIEIGNIRHIFNYNHYEGPRVGIPLVSNEKLFKRVELSAYIGYGFTDKALKGQGMVRVLLPTKRRNLLGISYTDDYTHYDTYGTDYFLHENSPLSGEQDLAHALFGSIRTDNQTTTTAVRCRQGGIWINSDLSKHLETQFAARIGRMGYGSPYEGYHQMPSFRFNTFQAGFRLGWDERKADRWMRRYYVHSKYPVLRMMLEAGSYRISNQEIPNQDDAAPYARLSVMIEQKVNLGVCGKLDYMASAGVVFGAVPYPFLQHFMGNQSYAYDPYRFTLMNASQYAADKYITAHLHWNMQGLLFNRIPYIRALRLRELVEMKVAYGGLDKKHNNILPLPQEMKAPTTPYIETGIGIGNILRLIDLYAVFRLTNLKNTDTPWWGIRARFSLGL